MDLDSLIFLGAASIFAGNNDCNLHEAVVQARKLWKEVLEQKRLEDIE